nr:MAG TPA: hypothetical protein [Caudoviricetes sp.]
MLQYKLYYLNSGLADYITNRILCIKREGISPLNYFTGIGL